MMTNQTKTKVSKVGIVAGILSILVGATMCIIALAHGEDLDMGSDWIKRGVIDNAQENSVSSRNAPTK